MPSYEPVLSQSEVAARLNLPLRTVQADEERAIRKLRLAIRQDAKEREITVEEWLRGG